MQELLSKDIEKFATIISEANTISIVTHMNPDGDAFGSTIAMQKYLSLMHGKDAMIIDQDPCPDSLAFMFRGDNSFFLSHKIQPDEVRKRIADSDTIICLDFNAFPRSGSVQDFLSESTARKVLVDHHLSPAREMFDLVFSETEVSSACELLFHILMKMPDISGDVRKMPVDCGTALLTGMTTDTNNFANSVFPTTLVMASSLLEAGVDRDAIISSLYNRYRENRVRLMGRLLDSNLKITDNGVAYMILDKNLQKEFDMKEGETEGFVNIPLSIDKVIMSLLLKEDDGFMRVSIRSKVGVSANRCARLYFNGGGHEQAAGGRLFIPTNISSADEAESYILETTARFLKEGQSN